MVAQKSFGVMRYVTKFGHIFSLFASLLWDLWLDLINFWSVEPVFLGGGEIFVSSSAGLSTKPGNFAFLGLFLS